MSKRLTPGEYRRRMDAIKPFVDFNYKAGSRRTKSIISRYYNQLNPLIEKGYKPRGAKKKSARKLIAETFDVDYRRRLKAIPIPPEVTDVKIRKDNVTYSRSGIRTKTTRMDKKAFAADTPAYIAKITKKLGGNRFRIRAGKYYVPGTYGPQALAEAIGGLQRKYGNWESWLSIEAVDYDDDNDEEEGE